jgi:hypothetical protein
MNKEWYEESSEEFADGFTEERQVHHGNPQSQSNEKLEATYGPAAPFSEHHRGEHITYITAEGKQARGTIIWVQAAHQDIPQKYVVAPDEPDGFLDFAMPSDVVTDTSEEPVMQLCPWCNSHHYDVNKCPLNPNRP